MNGEIVRQIVEGSAAIDRMRKEIHFVISCLLGFLPGLSMKETDKITEDDLGLVVSDGVRFIGDPDLNWEWLLKMHKGKAIVLFVVNGFYVGTGQELGAQVYTSELDENQLVLGEVQDVHSHLDDFVEGMFELFPSIKEEVEPLIKASTHFQQAP